MKVDVEGHEAAVFRGARRVLEENRPMIVFESVLAGAIRSTIEPLHILQAQDYRFFQPAFLRESEGLEYLAGYGDNCGVKGPVRLVLVPFLPRERSLLGRQINVFACPTTRLLEVDAALGCSRAASSQVPAHSTKMPASGTSMGGEDEG